MTVKVASLPLHIKQDAQVSMTASSEQALSLQHYIRNLEIHARINTRSKSRFCRIRRSIVWMQSNLGQRLTLEQLSKISAMSKFNYAREFKYQTGSSPMTYLTMLRVEHAKALIDEGQASMCSIADLCGFGTQAHFSAVFRRYTGMTPSGYKRSVRP